MTEHPPTNIDRLRESVTTRVNATSLRAVAREVGMSPSGLEKFIAGGKPYSGTRRKLYNWWLREGFAPRGGVLDEGVGAALLALVHELPPERREGALLDLVRTLQGLYAQQGALCPPWIAEIVTRWNGDPLREEGPVAE